MERRGTPAQHSLPRLQHALPDPAVDQGGALGVPYFGTHDGTDFDRLAADVQPSDLLSGNLRRRGAISRHVLPRGQLGVAGEDDGARQAVEQLRAESIDQRGTRLSTAPEVPRLTQPVMKKNSPRRRRLDVEVEELDRIIDDAKTAPLSEADSQKLKTALHALAENLLPQRNTEKTSSVFGDAEQTALQDTPAEADQPSG